MSKTRQRKQFELHELDEVYEEIQEQDKESLESRRIQIALVLQSMLVFKESLQQNDSTVSLQ